MKSPNLIFYVEDMAFWVSKMRRYLRKLGVSSEFLSAPSSDEFLARYDKEDKPDIIFLDIKLGHKSSLDGLDLLKVINNELGNGVIVGMLSTSDEEVEIEKAKANGARFYVHKQGDVLLERLEMVLKTFEDDKDAPFLLLI